LKLLAQEAQELIKPFTLTELEEALKNMDANASPGPEGLSVGFYKEFWSDRGQICHPRDVSRPA
jgi:hypothetical protein